MELIYRYDPYRPLTVDTPHDAESALRILLDGNDRFVRFVMQMQSATLGESPPDQAVIPIDLISMGLPLLPGIALDQRPFALVLGCADARVPIERVFDQSFNHLFVVRIAGNVLGTECLGSFDYAIRSFRQSLQLVVVLGHSGCGAVSAAVDSYLNPMGYAEIAFTHALRSLVDRIMIAVRCASRAFDEVVGQSIRTHPNYRTALIEASVYLNAAITAFDLWRELGTMGESSVDVMYGVCELGNLLVRNTPLAMPPTAVPAKPQIGKAPEDAAEFIELAHRFVKNILASGTLEPATE